MSLSVPEPQWIVVSLVVLSLRRGAGGNDGGPTEDFKAPARDADGNQISGSSFSWSSSASSVATVDGHGVATARANGAGTIEAVADGVIGTARDSSRMGPSVVEANAFAFQIPVKADESTVALARRMEFTVPQTHAPPEGFFTEN